MTADEMMQAVATATVGKIVECIEMTLEHVERGGILAGIEDSIEPMILDAVTNVLVRRVVKHGSGRDHMIAHLGRAYDVLEAHEASQRAATPSAPVFWTKGGDA